MTDIDQLLRDHAAAAARVEVAPGGFARLTARLDDVPSHVVALHAPRRRARCVVVAAAGLVVALGVAAVLVARDGGEEVRIGPSTSTAPSTTATTTAPIDVGPVPTVAVAIVDPDGDGGGEVVRLDGIGAGDSSTAASVVLVAAAPSSEPGVVGASRPGALTVDLGPDGVAYYERCCDPAGSEILAVDVATGTPVAGFVAIGSAPAVSPDGERLALARPEVGVVIIDLETGDLTALEGPDDEGHDVTALAWSPDGGTLAREVVDIADGAVRSTDVEVIELDGDGGWRPATSDTDGGIPPQEDGVGIAMPAFLADGRLVVGTRTRTGGTDVVATGMAVVDLDTGALSPRQGGVDITAIDATPDGRWIVAATPDGALRAFSGVDLQDSGTVGGTEAPLDVAW